MGDARAVRAVERVADLDRNRQRGLDRKPRRPVQLVLERFAFEILQDEVVELPVAADVVDGTDVRIVQGRNRARFLLEALPRFRIAGEHAGEHLDGDRAIEPDVARTVDLAHTALANRTENLVRTDASARAQRHVESPF